MNSNICLVCNEQWAPGRNKNGEGGVNRCLQRCSTERFLTKTEMHVSNKEHNFHQIEAVIKSKLASYFRS